MAEAKPNKRPHRFKTVTKQLLEAILKDIQEGSPKKHAAEANGISDRHFYNLLAQGIVDLEYQKDTTLQAWLVRSLRKIEQKEIKDCRAKIKKEKKGHRGAEWTLEHAYWRYFGKDANAKELAEEIDRLKAELKGENTDVNLNSGSTEENS